MESNHNNRRDGRNESKRPRTSRPRVARNEDEPIYRSSNSHEEGRRPQRTFNRNNNEGSRMENPRRRFNTDSENRRPSRESSERRFNSEQGERRFNKRPNNHRRQVSTPTESKSAPKYTEKTEIRLNKYIANAGICSRREADKLISAGAISVNGQVVTELGFKVTLKDVVVYGGERLQSEQKRYFLLNKPKGFITTMDDPQERKTVMALIENACQERIYPVGRLDRQTTGLLLFTNDGEMSRKLTHPSTGVHKIYQVEVDHPMTKNDMIQILEGIELEDGFIKVDDVQYAGQGLDRCLIGVALHSGKNRIVRRIFEHMGYEVLKLDRVVFAGLTKKNLPRGRYRELTTQEINFLKMI